MDEKIILHLHSRAGQMYYSSSSEYFIALIYWWLY